MHFLEKILLLVVFVACSVSQIAIGEFNKVGDKTVQVFVKVGGENDKQKLLIGNLSQKIPQVTLDLIFEQDFEISHECKSTSVYILGYKTIDSMDDEVNSGEFRSKVSMLWWF